MQVTTSNSEFRLLTSNWQQKQIRESSKRFLVFTSSYTLNLYNLYIPTSTRLESSTIGKIATQSYAGARHKDIAE